MNLYVEILGTIASILILCSTLCKTNTYEGALKLRIFNLVGSLLYTVYGVLRPSVSIILLDGFAIFVNSYHLWRLKKDYRK